MGEGYKIRKWIDSTGKIRKQNIHCSALPNVKPLKQLLAKVGISCISLAKNGLKVKKKEQMIFDLCSDTAYNLNQQFQGIYNNNNNKHSTEM